MTKFFLILACFFTCYNAIAQQPGQLDFPYVIVNKYIDTGSVKTIVQQSDGKFLLGGDFTVYNGLTRKNLIRINHDGEIDTTFYNTTDGITTGAGSIYKSIVNAVALLLGGKVLVGGRFNYYGNKLCIGIARLNTDGSIDTTFNNGTVSGIGFEKSNGIATINAIKLQSDGKIIVGGDFTTYRFQPVKGIARLNTNGTLDTTFNTNGMGFQNNDNTAGIVETILLQNNGSIIAGGSFRKYNGTAANLLCRLNTNGSLDATFSGGNAPLGLASAGQSVHVVKRDLTGNLLIGGNFTLYGSNTAIGFVKTDSNAVYTLSSQEYLSDVRDIAVSSSNDIYCSGSFWYFPPSGNGLNYGIIKFDSTGNTDTTFAVQGGFSPAGTQNIYTLYLENDSSIYTGGYFNKYKSEIRLNGIAKLNNLGKLDTTIFIKQPGFSHEVTNIAVQADNKVIAVGYFNKFNYDDAVRIIRLNTDGTRDTSFHTGSGFNNLTNVAAVQPDQKILVGGIFTAYNGVACSAIQRLMPNGSIDTSFHIGAGFYGNSFNNFYGIVNQIVPLANGKILVGGNFKAYNNVTRYGLVRLNSDGTLDNSFHVGLDTILISPAEITVLTVAPDNKILIGGQFLTFDGEPIHNFMRLNEDGTKDLTFDHIGDALEYYNGPNFTTYGANANTIKIQQDGKILVGGAFLQYDTVLVHDIVRLNTNGSLDTTFHFGSGFFFLPETFAYYNYGAVLDIFIQPDQKIIAAGVFQKYNGTPVQNLIRLNQDGSIDNAFHAKVGDNSLYNYGDDEPFFKVSKIVAQPNNQIVICGLFNDYYQNVKVNIARLNNASTLTATALDVVTQNNVPAGITSNQGTLQLLTVFTPAGSSQNVVWSSAATNIATVNASGLVTAAANGTVWIKAVATQNAQLKDSILVTVSNQGGNTAVINQQEDLPQLTLYPNPTTQRIALKSEKPLNKSNVIILDANGRVVKTDYIPEQSREIWMDVNALPAGTYFISLTDIKNTKRLKFVKE